MSYGHAERNLALIRQLEAETRQLSGSRAQSEQEQLPEPRQSAELGILTKLDLPESDTEHRRVLAVPRFLDAR
jgi:hypothetical protein